MKLVTNKKVLLSDRKRHVYLPWHILSVVCAIWKGGGQGMGGYCWSLVPGRLLEGEGVPPALVLAGGREPGPGHGISRPELE